MLSTEGSLARNVCFSVGGSTWQGQHASNGGTWEVADSTAMAAGERLRMQVHDLYGEMIINLVPRWEKCYQCARELCPKIMTLQWNK
jgi:hypothetical protein